MSESGSVGSEYSMDVVVKTPIIQELPKNEEGQKYGYIQETMQKVSNQSETNLHNFLDGENFTANLTVSLIDHYKMELLLKKFPDKREQILPLMILDDDKQHTQDFSASYKILVERNRLIGNVPWGEGEQDEFNEEARHLAKTEGEDLLRVAKQEVEGSQQEGLVLIISLNSQDIKKVIQDGHYKASLDNPDRGYKTFSEPNKEKIREQSALTREELSDRTIGNNIGLGSLETRYLRELQMGIYPIGGDESGVPHPVYGQMIVDQNIGLLQAKEAGYGKLNLRLNTERIKDRTTFFTGDSINNSWQGYQLRWNEAVKARGILDKLAESSKVDWRQIIPYLEAHIMGGVLMQDIDGCNFESSDKTKELEDYFSANPEKFEVTKKENNSVSVRFKW